MSALDGPAATETELYRGNKSSAIYNLANLSPFQPSLMNTSSNQSQAEYPALAAAPSNLLAESEGGALGSLAQGYLNNKRARKMSAFVPMRGRKDGRDSMMGGEQLPLLLASGGDSDNEISVVRLLAASNGQVEPSGAHWSTPRQFANQMLARHMELGEESAVAPSSSGYLGGAPMMQAKLRRAFHPMRGKRLTSLDLASLVDELQPDAWTSS